jgi:uncharacterized protein Usg
MANLALQLKDYRLTTAQILYHLPDHPSLLQEFIWQEMDIAPKFPVLHGFLEYWERHLDGRLHSVKVTHQQLITPADFRTPGGAFRIH